MIGEASMQVLRNLWELPNWLVKFYRYTFGLHLNVFSPQALFSLNTAVLRQFIFHVQECEYRKTYNKRPVERLLEHW